MSSGSRNLLRKVLVLAAVVEIGTGVGFVAVPTGVIPVLLGADVAGVGILLGRCFGVALLALGIACWLGIGAHMSGILLWPAVLLHAGVALLLAWTQRNASSARGIAT